MPDTVVLTQEHKTYLNDLQRSGVVNMFGSGEYVQDEFGVTRHEARAIVKQWMKWVQEQPR